jgi:hypothetical protein
MDVYCERVAAGLLAEPLNAITNLAFILAAWAVWRMGKKAGHISTEMNVMLWLAVSVGIGSGLWHTVANSLTLVLDIVPIFFLIMWFVWVYSRSVIKLSHWRSTGMVGLFVGLTYAGLQFSHILHGALVYTPTLIILIGLGIFHSRRMQTEQYTLFVAAGVYLAALVFRTIDNEVCSFLPIGTHFLWHTLAGLTVYLTMRTTLLGQNMGGVTFRVEPVSAAA